MIRVFAGLDERERVGYQVFAHSLLTQASQPIALTQLNSRTFAGRVSPKGTNDFGVLRFLVPMLCDYVGFAIFMDGSDMLMRADVAELWEQRPLWGAVSLVKHHYQTKHARKYIGTEMEADNRDYPRKNWSSVMLINCSHFAWRGVDEKFVSTVSALDLHRLSWMADEHIVPLASEWNHLVGEQPKNPEAKVVHYTLGIPAFPYYCGCEFAEEWHKAYTDMLMPETAYA